MDKLINGKVYRLVSKQFDKYYIGSTAYSLEERLDTHINSYSNWFSNNFKNHYISSFEILKYGDYCIELIEDCPEVSRNDLEKREQYHQIINYKDIVNICIAGIPFFRKAPFVIGTDDIYTCSCGISLKNQYTFRKAHSIQKKHKRKICEIHTRTIENHPSFELIEVEIKPVDVYYGKNGTTLTINY